jgi:hypothetical protein
MSLRSDIPLRVFSLASDIHPQLSKANNGVSMVHCFTDGGALISPRSDLNLKGTSEETEPKKRKIGSGPLEPGYKEKKKGKKRTLTLKLNQKLKRSSSELN